MRSVFRPESIDVDDRADHELFFADAATHQLPGRAARQSPQRSGAVRVLHLDVVPDVWIRPLDLLERAGQLDRLRVVELCGKRMMREQSRAAEKTGEQCDEHERLHNNLEIKV